ncbi:hypothetical protein LX64_01849 [Chitinophaga skermanii]|uniref:DUF3592 domain-containing protein n=1 Tax=Chitinophaga skermanii TaxID=331697 RepID=A0A327QSQ1_9BACT|nr:hypothetical protein [Chitinophaga skermanii]RAJ06722.1 hypothetical protein LX64_01849 [Chitinophaga skermanii]
MKTFVFFAGLILFIGSLLLIGANMKVFEIAQDGKIVKMVLIEKPPICLGTKPYVVTFSYEGQNYNKQVRGTFCEDYKIGDIFDMKMLPGEDTVLWINETGVSNLVAGICLALFGVGCSIGVVISNILERRSCE